MQGVPAHLEMLKSGEKANVIQHTAALQMEMVENEFVNAISRRNI